MKNDSPSLQKKGRGKFVESLITQPQPADCRILLKFGKRVRCGSAKAVEWLKYTYTIKFKTADGLQIEILTSTTGIS